MQKLTMENKDKIPPLVQDTLPQGAKLGSHFYGRNYGLDTRVDLSYMATKPNPNPLILYPETGYNLDCHVITPSDPICQTMAKYYPQQEYTKLKALADVKSEPGFVRTAQERDEAWGKSVTVREVYTPMGEGNPKPHTFYHFYAAGRVGDVLFKASAACMPDDTSRGDEWFNKLIGSMKKWSVSSLTI